MSSKSFKNFFKVELGVVTLNKIARQNLIRHKARFVITSFIYRSRRPFHPYRFGQHFVEPFFSKMNLLEGLERVEEVEEEKQKGEEEEEKDKVLRDELRVQKLQEEAGLKQAKRTGMIGQLLRSKGDLLILLICKLMVLSNIYQAVSHTYIYITLFRLCLACQLPRHDRRLATSRQRAPPRVRGSLDV